MLRRSCPRIYVRTTLIRYTQRIIVILSGSSTKRTIPSAHSREGLAIHEIDDRFESVIGRISGERELVDALDIERLALLRFTTYMELWVTGERAV